MTGATGHELLALFAAAGLSDPRIAKHYGVTARTVHRWRTAEGIPSSWSPPPWGHDLNGYQRGGCRCDVCKAANNAHSARMRANRRGRRDESGVAPVDQHNAATGRNWGCKCAVCVAAIAEANRAYRAPRSA